MSLRIEEDGIGVIEKPIITPSRQRKLDLLEAYLIHSGSSITDPIAFIKLHYYGDENQGIAMKSLAQLRDFLFSKGVDYKTEEGLRQMLKDLGVSLRGNQEKTEIGGESSGNNHHNVGKRDENIAKFRRTLLEIIQKDEVTIDHFDKEKYEALRFPVDKALYLLGLDKQKLLRISEVSCLGKNTLCKCLNIMLEEISIKLGDEVDIPTIQSGSVGNILKKLKQS